MSPDGRSIPVWLWLVVWIACVGVTLAVQPDQSVDRRLNALQVLGKSSEDRETIKSNWDEYRQLPQPERAKVKQLHADLQVETQLKPVLKDYLEWRDRASKHFPDEVARLDAETDPIRKANEVNRIIELQNKRMRAMLSFSSEPPEPREPREMTMRRGLSRTELEAIQELLEPIVKSLVSADDWKAIDSSRGLGRTARVLTAAAELTRNGRLWESNRRSEELFKKIQEALGHGQAAQLLEQQVTGEGKAGALRGLILSGLMRQVTSESYSPEELEAARKKLERENPRIGYAPPHIRDFWIKVMAVNEKYPEFSRLFERHLREMGGPGFGPGSYRGNGNGGRGEGSPGSGRGDGPPRDGFGPGFGGRPPFGPPPPNGRDDRPRRAPDGDRHPDDRPPEDRERDDRGPPPPRGPDGRGPGEERPPDGPPPERRPPERRGPGELRPD